MQTNERTPIQLHNKVHNGDNVLLIWKISVTTFL